MLLINITGLCLIALIVWWFWLYKPNPAHANNNNLVVVVENGVYSPAHIFLNKGMPEHITFLRKDQTPCAETLLIPGLGINETLPINKPVSVLITANDNGEYAFHCQMNMYKGLIIIRS